MILINEDNVRDLKSLMNSNPAAYGRVTYMLDKNFHDINDALNHLDPSTGGINFTSFCTC